MSGAPVDALAIFVFGTAGLFALAGAVEGYLEAPLGWIARTVLALVGTGLLWPLGWRLQSLMLFVMVGVVVLNVRRHRAVLR